jgi:hypothetical protein
MGARHSKEPDNSSNVTSFSSLACTTSAQVLALSTAGHKSGTVEFSTQEGVVVRLTSTLPATMKYKHSIKYKSRHTNEMQNQCNADIPLLLDSMQTEGAAAPDPTAVLSTESNALSASKASGTAEGFAPLLSESMQTEEGAVPVPTAVVLLPSTASSVAAGFKPYSG